MTTMSVCVPKEQDQSSLRNLHLGKEIVVDQEQAAGISRDEIPDGGLSAYLQVFGAFLMFFNSW